MEDPRGGLGTCMLVYTAIFLAVTILLLVFRRLTRWHIQQLGIEDVSVDYRPNQFGIKHLVILVTITALACGLCKTLLMMNTNSTEGDTPVAICIGIIAMISFLLFPVLVVPWYALAYRGRAVSLVLATIAILAACDLAIYGLAMAMLPVGRSLKGIVRPFLLIQLGASLSIFLSTLVIRWCGFRMIREPKHGRSAETTT
jgi:hypothetical protein